MTNQRRPEMSIGSLVSSAGSKVADPIWNGLSMRGRRFVVRRSAGDKHLVEGGVALGRNDGADQLGPGAGHHGQAVVHEQRGGARIVVEHGQVMLGHDDHRHRRHEHVGALVDGQSYEVVAIAVDQFEAADGRLLHAAQPVGIARDQVGRRRAGARRRLAGNLAHFQHDRLGGLALGRGRRGLPRHFEKMGDALVELPAEHLAEHQTATRLARRRTAAGRALRRARLSRRRLAGHRLGQPGQTEKLLSLVGAFVFPRHHHGVEDRLVIRLDASPRLRRENPLARLGLLLRLLARALANRPRRQQHDRQHHRQQHQVKQQHVAGETFDGEFHEARFTSRRSESDSPSRYRR